MSERLRQGPDCDLRMKIPVKSFSASPPGDHPSPARHFCVPMFYTVEFQQLSAQKGRKTRERGSVVAGGLLNRFGSDVLSGVSYFHFHNTLYSRFLSS